MFIRLGKLADKLVGKTARGKRSFIRWPKELVDYTKAVNHNAGNMVIGGASILLVLSIPLAIMLATLLEIHDFLRLMLLLIAAVAWAGVMADVITAFIADMDIADMENEQSRRTGEIMKPLLGNDPYLDLRLAAFLTVGAMPKWLQEQMGLGSRPEWRRARLAEEPYTVERAGFDYLDLMLRTEQLDKTPSMFYGKSFPSAGYKLPDSLKDAVGEIILFLSSPPETEKDPGEDTVGSVMDTIDHLATIDGESFTAAVRRLHAEEKNGKKNKVESGRDDEIMKAVAAANNAMTVRTDEQYKAVLQGMDRLSKMSRAIELSKTDEHAAEPSAA